MKHILEILCDQPWAITSRAMEGILSIVDRQTDVEAVAAKLGKPLQNTGGRVEMRGNVAVMEITGPLFRYANMFTMCSGATSVEMLGQDFSAAMANPAVEAVLLNINSPGGQADGVGELAHMIYEARAKKPVTAYVGGTGASGGYWLAAAAERVVTHETAFLGSIGCVATIMDERERDRQEGVRRYEIVSSQSPRKRTDIATEEGQAEIQSMVDAMAAVFVSRVAQYRGTTPENVLENFGKGFVLPGARAVAAGMADGIGSFEGALAELSAQVHSSAGILIAANGPAAKEAVMAEEKQPSTGDIRAAAVTAERTRINAILTCAEANGRQKLAMHLALDTNMPVEEAKGILFAAEPVSPPAAPAASADPLAAHMKAVANPQVGTGLEPESDDQSEIRAVLAFVPASRRRAS